MQCVTPCFCLPAVIPKVTKHLLSNPVFTCIILAACMEIAVVAGFAAFLGKYLEQQFNLTTSSANQLLGESAPPAPREGRGLLSCRCHSKNLPRPTGERAQTLLLRQQQYSWSLCAEESILAVKFAEGM